MSWDRLLWGVEFSSPLSKPGLLGKGWAKVVPESYDGEPSHCLLFRSRSAARAWCKGQLDKYGPRKDLCSHWKFRVVRVREVVRKV